MGHNPFAMPDIANVVPHIASASPYNRIASPDVASSRRDITFARAIAPHAKALTAVWHHWQHPPVIENHGLAGQSPLKGLNEA
ncbi:MAG: hypothetical protein H7Z11_23655, partial [Verrucomicrobia bacterium]|nr:hypothetical protein [Leptolyngbya sp. ES-bin-22]